MDRRRRPLLLTLMLMAIAVRTVFGAPCCLDMAQAAPVTAQADHADHANPDEAKPKAKAERGTHDNHTSTNAAGPCCSACGPTLPPETPVLAAAIAARDLPQPAAIRALATRPPYPAYEATGPPFLI